jgi:predicted DNA-binding transcriptional regulator AlpA
VSSEFPIIEPLAVDAQGFARLAGISRALVWKMASSGRCPAPVRIGRLCRWPVDAIRVWLSAGCPAVDERAAREAMKTKRAELSKIGAKGCERANDNR